MILRCLLCLTGGVLLAQSGLEEIRQQPNLDRRFDAALQYSAQSMQQARRVVSEAGTVGELRAALEEVTAGLETALDALKATGKPPRRLTRQYKKGELRSRDILRQLEQLVPAISLDSRPPAEEAREKVSALHEKFLRGVMGGK